MMYDISERYATNTTTFGFLNFPLVWFMTNAILCTRKLHFFVLVLVIVNP